MSNERTVPAIRAMLCREFDPNEVEIFLQMHKANPHVFKAFEEEAISRIRSGKQRLSSKGIIEFLRDNQTVQTTGMKGFNISNTYTAYYSRIFCHLHPIHRHLWQFGEIKQKEAA
jgi:hypothetical protein